jgi:LysM repeat protein
MAGGMPIETPADAPFSSGEAPPPTQLAAFDAEEPSAIMPPPLTVSGPADAQMSADRPDPVAANVAPGAASEPAAVVPAPEVEPAAAVPAFLVGRSTRSRSGPPIDEKIARDDVVPSWDIDGRFGAEAGSRPDRPGAFSRLLTIIAVVVILGLGIAAVIIVPGLLSSQPRSTVRPSFATVPSPSRSPLQSSIAGIPTVAPSAVATPARPTDPPDPTAQPTPAASPVLYRIRSGDTLAKIARRNGITVPELLAANPQITNPDHVEVGQIIVIPPPSATPAP